MTAKLSEGDLPPPPPELDPREPPAPTSVPHRTPSRAQFHSPTAQTASHARSARTSPAHSRATSPSPAVGSPLGVLVSSGLVGRDSSASGTTSAHGSPPLLSMAGVSHHTHSAPHSPSSLIFERDVTLIPPPIDLSHKPSRLSSPAPHLAHSHGHFDASDGKVPTVLDDAVEALAAVQVSGSEWGAGSGMSGGSGIIGGDAIEIEGPVSAVHYRPRPAMASQPGSSSGVGSGERSPVGGGIASGAHGSTPQSGPTGEDSFGSRLPVPGTSSGAVQRHASDPPPTRPELKARQSSAGPSLPGAFPGAGGASGTSAIKEWKRKIKDWVGPKPGPGVFPDEVEEAEPEQGDEQERGRTGGAGQAAEVDLGDDTPDREESRSKSISPTGAGQLLSPPSAVPAGLSSQPMTPSASGHTRTDKRRISFVSYNDLLQSVPTTISPLSEIANGHIEPDHLPGTVSPVRAASPFASAASPSPRSPGDHARALGMKRGSEPNLSSFGSRVDDHARGRLAAQSEEAGPGAPYERERSTSTFQREGLGKGLTERLEMLIAEGD